MCKVQGAEGKERISAVVQGKMVQQCSRPKHSCTEFRSTARSPHVRVHFCTLALMH